MKPAVGRVLLTAALFVGWLGYLGYLVVCGPHTPDGLRGAFEGRPLALSRPQFLVSMLDVRARVDKVTGEDVRVEEVLFPSENAPVKAGDTIHVENIDKCRPLPTLLEKDQEPPADWTGPGEYILPLQIVERNAERHYEVVPTPPSPGYPPRTPLLHNVNVGPPRIYPATPEMLAEYKEIAKPK
jgi:hypothetical protein